MGEELIESYLGIIYIWRVSKKEFDHTHDKVLTRISKMNEVLLGELFEIPADSYDNFIKIMKFYRNELKMIIPNINIVKDQFIKKLSGKFFKLKSSIIDYNVDAVHMIIESLKSHFIYFERIPKMFVSDLILSEKEALFKEKILKLKTLNAEIIHKQIIENFQDFFKVSKEEFSEFVLIKTKEILHQIKGKVEVLKQSISEKLLGFLQGLFNIEKLVSIEIQIKKIDDQNGSLSPNWETVHKGILISEDIKLIQVLKTSPIQSLISIRLFESKLTLIILLENYISKRIQKIITIDFDLFIPGSVPELILFYSNIQKKMWKGQITEKKLIEQDSIDFFKNDEKIVSSYLIRHQLRIIYVTQTGGVHNFSLKGGEKLDMSSVYPQKYLKVIVSDCERFIFLISNSNFNIFNSNMEVITFHKISPVFLYIQKENLKILVQEEEVFQMKTLNIGPKMIESLPDTGMKMEKAKLLTRMTFEFGKQMFKDMFNINKFEGDMEEKKNIEKK